MSFEILLTLFGMTMFSGSNLSKIIKIEEQQVTKNESQACKLSFFLKERSDLAKFMMIIARIRRAFAVILTISAYNLKELTLITPKGGQKVAVIIQFSECRSTSRI